MNGIEKITGKIAVDAKQEAEAILSQARSEAAAIAGKYQAQSQEEAKKILVAGEEQAKEIRRRAKAAAELEGRQKVLTTKQELIAQAFDKALEKLLSLPAPEYTALLAQLASRAAGSGSETVVMSPKDREALGQAVVEQANKLLSQSGKAAGLTLSSETRDFKGGLLLKSGDVEVNCTLETIVQLSKEELALDVAAALFA
ncbi:MAG: V-type ATP synthase subunit E family protein [Peptococcaceae bacterium]|nr:V-type ATP synthase subunit E family protein [Peptococcaceae bacterium]